MPSRRSTSSNGLSPALAARFTLEWGAPDGATGFLRVEPGPLTGGAGDLRLTRAVDGRRDLMDWLADGKSARTLRLSVMDGAGQPVAVYRFEGARPVSLQLSPLDAMADDVLTESLLVHFERVQMEI